MATKPGSARVERISRSSHRPLQLPITLHATIYHPECFRCTAAGNQPTCHNMIGTCVRAGQCKDDIEVCKHLNLRVIHCVQARCHSKGFCKSKCELNCCKSGRRYSTHLYTIGCYYSMAYCSAKMLHMETTSHNHDHQRHHISIIMSIVTIICCCHQSS